MDDKEIARHSAVWIHGITLGVQLLFASGLMVQLYPRLLEIGINPQSAGLMMLASGLFALPGSYICGVIDSKIGARKAACTTYVFGLVAMLCNLTGNIVLVWVSLVCIGVVVGGAANWPASLCIEEFGPSFASGYGVMQPISGSWSSRTGILRTVLWNHRKLQDSLCMRCNSYGSRFDCIYGLSKTWLRKERGRKTSLLMRKKKNQLQNKILKRECRKIGSPKQGQVQLT